jgi:ABC-type transporter Mla subunit MlaD
MDMAEVDKARLRGVVTSLRSSLESLKSHLAGLEGYKNNLPETVRTQEQQIEDLGQIISALLTQLLS